MFPKYYQGSQMSTDPEIISEQHQVCPFPQNKSRQKESY